MVTKNENFVVSRESHKSFFTSIFFWISSLMLFFIIDCKFLGLCSMLSTLHSNILSCSFIVSVTNLEELFFVRRGFLPYVSSPHLVHLLPQPPFIDASLGAGSSSSKSVGFHPVVQNTVQAQLFIWITQQYTNLMFRKIFI